MPRRWLRALKAAALVAVIASGGGGMPVLDVVLYHGLAPSRSTQPHFEPAGAHCHGELCRLDSRFPYSTQAVSPGPGIPIVTAPFRELALLPSVPHPANLELLPHPRAPPSLPA